MANEAERAESGGTQLAPARVAGGTRCASVVKGPVAALWMACRTAGRQDPRTPRDRRATQAGEGTGTAPPNPRLGAAERRRAGESPSTQAFRRRKRGKTICRVVPVVGLSLLSGEGVSATVEAETERQLRAKPPSRRFMI